MELPYIVDARPDTGINNGKLGTWLFLASEVMLFGALFASYIMMRIGGTEWPAGHEILHVPMATINTVVLITSSVTMVMAWASCMRRNFNQFRFFMGSTVVLGGVFMVIKYMEYSQKFHHELFPSTNTFLAIYFTMTGLHALHVLGGMIINSYFIGRIPSVIVYILGMVLLYLVLLVPLRASDVWLAKVSIYLLPLAIVIGTLFLWRYNNSGRMWSSDPQWFTNRVEHVGLFWHFVDLVWIFLFPVFYLL